MQGRVVLGGCHAWCDGGPPCSRNRVRGADYLPEGRPGQRQEAPRRTPGLHLAVLVAGHPELLSDGAVGIAEELFAGEPERGIYRAVVSSGAKLKAEVM